MSTRGEALLGIIGGSGLYRMAGSRRCAKSRISTPFGEPSDAYVVGTLARPPRRVPAAPRLGHRLLPCELNFRANIHGFKAARRRRHRVDLGGRQPARGDRARARRGARPVHRPHARPHLDVLRRRLSSRTCRFADPFCAPLSRWSPISAREAGADGARGRHLRLHGRAAVLDARRVPPVPELGRETSSA